MARILTCVPPQHHTLPAKLEWLEETAAEHKPDLFVMPQEYFGGMMMPQQMAFTESELRPQMEELAARHNMGLLACLVEQDGDKRHERIWFVDPIEGLKGKVTKFALPAYSHIDTGGTYRASPETDLRNRSVIYELKGIRVGAFFCWEVFSDLLMFALEIAEPDIVATVIKFGTMAYPVNVGSKEEGRKVQSFALSSGPNVWMQRLQLASLWELSCPVVVSTNTWRLPSSSEPLCGKLPTMTDPQGTVWKPPKTRKIYKPDDLYHVQVDDVDPLKVQGLRATKWQYKNLTNEWPPFEVATYTMWRKIRRIERGLTGVVDLFEDFSVKYRDDLDEWLRSLDRSEVTG